VEPVNGMRVKLQEVLPEIEAVDGTAEAIPVPDASVDLVAAGQAFHWFDMERALPEIHRVLRTGGRLALLWNSRDLAKPLLAEIEELLEPHVPENVSRAGAMHGWREAIAGSPLFGPYEHKTFDNPHRLTREGLRDRIASTSFVAAMDGPARARLLDEVVALVDGVEEPFDFPYVTDVFVFPRSRDRA
jgi:SAM-dependent methyltransferase